MSWRDFGFSAAAGVSLAVGMLLLYKTVLVDHPEFVSPAKLLVGLIAWLAFIGFAAWVDRGHSLRLWCLLAVSWPLVLPTVLLFLRGFLRILGI
jgi:hypothetical protein